MVLGGHILRNVWSGTEAGRGFPELTDTRELPEVRDLTAEERPVQVGPRALLPCTPSIMCRRAPGVNLPPQEDQNEAPFLRLRGGKTRPQGLHGPPVSRPQSRPVRGGTPARSNMGLELGGLITCVNCVFLMIDA